jgi:hypothetical protein
MLVTSTSTVVAYVPYLHILHTCTKKYLQVKDVWYIYVDVCTTQFVLQILSVEPGKLLRNRCLCAGGRSLEALS